MPNRRIFAVSILLTLSLSNASNATERCQAEEVELCADIWDHKDCKRHYSFNNKTKTYHNCYENLWAGSDVACTTSDVACEVQQK